MFQAQRKKAIHLQQLLTFERKKSALSQVRAAAAAAAAKMIKSLQGRLQSCDASHLAAIKRLKGQITGLKIKEKLALEAASTSSKIVDDATKEAIGTKADCIRDTRKAILDLKKQVRDSKGLERQVSRLNSDIVALVKEKSEWKSLHQNLTKEVKLLNKKVNDQTDDKYVHQQKMADITLKGKQVTLAQGQPKNIESRSQK
jgi:vacuolar-type H+-ATPase subunit H